MSLRRFCSASLGSHSTRNIRPYTTSFDHLRKLVCEYNSCDQTCHIPRDSPAFSQNVLRNEANFTRFPPSAFAIRTLLLATFDVEAAGCRKTENGTTVQSRHDHRPTNSPACCRDSPVFTRCHAQSQNVPLCERRKQISVRLFLSEHRATRSLHLSRSLAIRRAPCQLTPISSRSSLKVLRHVYFSLPLLLLSSSGTQYMAVWAGLSLCSRRTWPAIFLLLVTMSLSRSMPALLITSSFVTWSRHEMQSSERRQRRSIACERSWPFSSTSHKHTLPCGSQRLCRRNFTFKLIT